ncbi:MAG: hypothetical protein KDE47_22435, partial [Caldilineaceae bacterium]|nr:hypothetical protein [Caldilineaceae bacterium]
DPPIVRMREIICSGELGALAMINSWSYGNFLYRPRRPEELKTEAGGGIIYNQVPHQVDVVRYLGGGLVESVRSMVWALDPARPTEGSHVTFLQFANGSAASLVFSGYDFFDSDEFHFWISESGEERQPGGHGMARAMLSRLTDPSEEVALQSAKAYGASVEKARSIGDCHHPHCGVTIASCEHGDLRPSADGVLIYDHNGCREVPIPMGRAFPDKTGVIDELYDAIAGVRLPIHDGPWGKATMEVAAAILQSSRERREIQMRYQVQLKKD